MKSKDRTVFLCDWYIIDAAKNWFDFGVSFNMIGEIKARYQKDLFNISSDDRQTQLSREEIFEKSLLEFIEDFKEKQNG